MIVASGYQGASPGNDSETLPFDSLAGHCGTPLHRAGQEWGISPIESDPSHFMFRYGSLQNIYPVPQLVGVHQLENAGAALACTYVTDSLPIHNESRAAGLKRVSWPGRLQRLHGHPLNHLIPAHWDLWLDGGHNDSAGQVLGTQARHWHATDPQPLHLVMGMKQEKDAGLFLSPLLPALTSLTIIPIPGMAQESHNAETIKAALKAVAPSFKTDTADTLPQALTRFQKNPAAGRILIAGSLYLAGAVLGFKAADPA